MIKIIKNVNFILNKNNSNNNYIYKKEIERFWNDYSKNKPEMFNGDVVSVSEIKEVDGNYNITIDIIKFCNIAYTKMVGNIKTRSLFSGGYIVTSDNYIGFAINKDNMINLVGGMASIEDFINDKYDSDSCIKREFIEEMGIDINDDKFSFQLKYIKYPEGEEDKKFHYPVGLIYEIKSGYSKSELDNLFKSLKHDNEISSILFFKLDEHFNIDNYSKKDYIDELYKIIVKEN